MKFHLLIGLVLVFTCVYNVQEGLLERQETLQWILDMVERPLKSLSSSEDGLFRLYLPLALQYMEEFVQSELLSRKLSYLCARKVSQLCSGEPQSVGGISPNSPAIHNTPTNTGNNQGSASQHQPNNRSVTRMCWRKLRQLCQGFRLVTGMHYKGRLWMRIEKPNKNGVSESYIYVLKIQTAYRLTCIQG